MKMKIPFQFEDEFIYGEVQQVSALIRRVVAGNPSRFTFRGTGTYIVGQGEVAVIDPGPQIAEHIDAIVDCLANETITHILVTHTHNDHSPGARSLQNVCDAAVYGMEYAANDSGDLVTDKTEEEIDNEFSPDFTLTNGDLLTGAGWNIECIHTPGHMPNHFCFRLLEEKALFTGDHIMGWSTTVIIPPYGSMADYVNSLKKLQNCHDKVYYPTHGPAVRHPQRLLNALIEHRAEREQQIIECLRTRTKTVFEMTAEIYADVDGALHGAASLSLYATLIKLVAEKRVDCDGILSMDCVFRLSG